MDASLRRAACMPDDDVRLFKTPHAIAKMLLKTRVILSGAKDLAIRTVSRQNTPGPKKICYPRSPQKKISPFPSPPPLFFFLGMGEGRIKGEGGGEKTGNGREKEKGERRVWDDMLGRFAKIFRRLILQRCPAILSFTSISTPNIRCSTARCG